MKVRRGPCLNDNEKCIIRAYEQDMELCKRKKKTVNNYWKPHKCLICKKAFCKTKQRNRNFAREQRENGARIE